ncbi:MAG TPA: hypothetical protein VK253_06010, partial [Candidatus Binatia bacterium]|nr:hypothetical protein [Candidatus Binatia bacterium]
SVYEVLSIISGLERVPYVPVSLTELRTLTPQKMRELEELVSQLSKVWQVVEEPDFLWRGYRADKYNLEIRSELLTTLENINETLRGLELAVEEFSACLGVFPPETFPRIQWLLDVSKLLFESPKPEAKWLTNSSLDKLLGEAQTYLDTSIWIKNTRANLLERYQQSLFTLDLTRSAEMQQAATLVAKMLPAVNVEEGELLSKRAKLLAYVRATQLVSRKWHETSQSLAQLLGLDGVDLTLTQLKQLSRIALLCFAEDKPEPEWFDAKYLEEVRETVSNAKELYQDYSLIKSRLEQTYNDGIYDLDLEGLIERYGGEYQSGLRIFNSAYRNDQKQIARLTNDGKVPKEIQQDLIDARKVKKMQTKIEESAEAVRTLLGHYYHKSRTDFLGAEKAIALTDEIKKLSWATQIPDALLKLLTASTSPSPMIKNLGLELQDSVSKWEQQGKDVESLIPLSMPKSDVPIAQMSMPLLEEWGNETEKQLTPLNNLTNQTLTAAKQEPQNYKQLIQDLKNAEDIRKKEAQIVGEKVQLQEKFGSRFQELETNWQDIVSVFEWCKKVQSAFGDIPVPQAFADISAQGPTAAPSSKELTEQNLASLKFLQEFEKRFESEMKYQNQKLKDLEIKVIRERIQALRDRVDDLQIWIDFKDAKNRFALRSLDPFFSRLVEQHIVA